MGEEMQEERMLEEWGGGRLMDKPLWSLRVQAPFGVVGIGTGTWAVLSSIPEG